MNGLKTGDRGWLEAGTVLYFEKQPHKSYIKRKVSLLHRHAHDEIDTLKAQLQQAVNENREWIDKWDAHDHYPHGYVHAQIGLCERTEAQFQAETLRTSMLAQLLLEFAKIYSVDHFQEAWPKACHRCDLLKETKQALELPVNTAWDDHIKLKAQLQQAVEALASIIELAASPDKYVRVRICQIAESILTAAHKEE